MSIFGLAGLASFILGMSKAGFKGLGFLVVTLMAIAYDAKASTGILMPLLIISDCLAIYFYRKDVDWKTLIKLLPWMAIGVVVGVFVGDNISESLFKKMMAIIIFGSGILMILFDRINKDYVPDHLWFSSSMGLAAGFTTMVGNLAGAFSNLYFLALRFPKKKFIGTAAWLFFVINLFKLPFHVLVWNTVNYQSLKINLYLIPFLVFGFFVGLRFIKLFSNELFKKYIIFITLLGSVIIFLK